MLEQIIGRLNVKGKPLGDWSKHIVDTLLSNGNYQSFNSTNKEFSIFGSTLYSSKPQVTFGKTSVVSLVGDLCITPGRQGIEDILSEDQSPSTIIPRFRQLLDNTNGTFVIVTYDAHGGLLIATDSLGARPLFYAMDDDTLYFSTSMSLLLQSYPGTHSVDIKALAEQLAFSCPLGSRTISSAVSVLCDGQYILAENGQLRVDRYHDWRTSLPVNGAWQQQLTECANAFNQAMDARIQNTAMQNVLLSGGLDSRMIAAKLRDMGKTVLAANCSAINTQDHHYCLEFAKVASIDVVWAPWTVDLIKESANATTAAVLSRITARLPVGKVFSGDGGGELFGFLDLSKEVLDQLKEHGLENVIHQLASNGQISKHIVTEEFSSQLEGLAHKGISAELDAMGSADPQKKLQLFFLLNELRCHLHGYFSSLDPAAQELLLPFYDRRVINSTIRIAPPFDSFRGHQFYCQLLSMVSPLIETVPWQSYPGAIAGPVVDSEVTDSQWVYLNKTKASRARYWRKAALRIAFTNSRRCYRKYRILFLVSVDLLTGQDFSYHFCQLVVINQVLKTLSLKNTSKP